MARKAERFIASRLYGLIRTGKRANAIRHAQAAGLTRDKAIQQVNRAAERLGMA